MVEMADFQFVPVVDVNAENFDIWYPTILLAVRNSLFVSLDLELSGIGRRQDINCSSVEDRYKALTEVAKTRAIISLGISCFKLQLANGKKFNEENRYLVQTFNILVLCQENYVVEPASLQFLIEHGFDFNRQYKSGLPYYRGCDKTDDNERHPTLRRLINEIIIARHPIVLHNGLVDLVFLYENLYCQLPSAFSSFLADISELFSSGIYDTKYICEFHARLPASYLQYIFRRKQRENADKMKKNKLYVSVEFLSYRNVSDSVDYLGCQLRNNTEHTMTVCQTYASHGWCSKRDACPLSHNIDDILDKEGCGLSRKRKKKQKMEDGESEEISNCASTSNEQSNEQMELDNKDDSVSQENLKNLNSNPMSHGGHRAGFDAFMTGFVFATYLTTYCRNNMSIDLTSNEESGAGNFINKIYLCGKNTPLIVTKGNFAKHSTLHKEKMNKLRL